MKVWMLVESFTLSDYETLLEKVRYIDYDIYMTIKFAVELGLATRELSRAKIENLREHIFEGKRAYLLKIDEGSKHVIVSRKTGKTKARYRYVVCNTLLSREIEGYIKSDRHKGKRRLIQSKFKYFDGIRMHGIVGWFRKYCIDQETGMLTESRKVRYPVDGKRPPRGELNRRYKLLIPFAPHCTKYGILGGRHLHKYLIEGVCVPLGIFSERQVELHLGHRSSRFVDYGKVPNYSLIFRMVEATFAQKQRSVSYMRTQRNIDQYI